MQQNPQKNMSVKHKKNTTTAVRQKQEKEITVNKNEKRTFPEWLPIAVILFTALLYSKSILNGFVNYDDNIYIVDDPYIRDFSLHGIKAIFSVFYQGNYHPLTQLLYLLTYKFFGLNAWAYHLLSVLLHLVNTWLVFKLTENLSGKKITALVVALLFAIHPMHVESVAWASSLKDVLCALFYLLALSVYLRYITTGFRAKYYIITMLLFLAALISKSAAVPLSVLLIAIDIYKGRKINRSSLLEKIPFLLVSLIFGLVNILSQDSAGAISKYIGDYGFINRVFLFTEAIAFYIINLVIPIWLAPMHYFPPLYGQFLPWMYYVSFPFVILICWFALKRSVLRKEAIFGLGFFLITMSVMLQFITPIGSHHTAERYTYIPYIGLFYIIGQWISGIAIKKWRNRVVIVFSFVIILFSIQTWIRIGIWKNDLALYSDWVEKSPGIFAFGYWTIGNTEKENGDLQAALQNYSKAIEANPKFDDAYFNRAKVYDDLKNIPLAIKDYSSSIQLKPGADAYNSRGWDYDQSGDIKSAMHDYNEAILLAPKYIKPYFNRAAIYTGTGNISAAIGDYDTILKINANDQYAYYYRGNAYFTTKDTVNACNDWKKAAELGNENALSLLGKYCK